MLAGQMLPCSTGVVSPVKHDVCITLPGSWPAVKTISGSEWKWVTGLRTKSWTSVGMKTGEVKPHLDRHLQPALGHNVWKRAPQRSRSPLYGAFVEEPEGIAQADKESFIWFQFGLCIKGFKGVRACPHKYRKNSSKFSFFSVCAMKNFRWDSWESHYSLVIKDFTTCPKLNMNVEKQKSLKIHASIWILRSKLPK